MSLSGSFSKSVHDGHYTLRVDWTASQSVANNTSTITAKVYFVHDWEIEIGSRSGNTITIAGTEYTFTSPAVKSSSGTHLLATITSNAIAHNSDGSKSISISCAWKMKATITSGGSSSYYGTLTASTTAALNTIPRASQPSCITWPEHTQNVGEFGDTISIHMNRKANVFTHTVRYQFGSQSGTIATDVTTGTTWVIPLSLMNLIPNTTSGSGTIYVDTYNGSTKIGTKSCGFTATVPSTVKPSCSATLEDVEGVDDIYGSPVQGLSKIKVTINASTAYSSAIKAYSITIDGVQYSESEVTSGYLVNAGTSTVTVSVTDNRGRSGSWSYDMTVQAYTPPAISKLTVHRCDVNGNEDDQGDYVEVGFSSVVTSLNSINTATYALYYKKTSETDYTVLQLSDIANTYVITDHIVTPFSADGNNSYDVVLMVTDRHKTGNRSTTVSTAFTLYNCHPSGTGWRFGGVAEDENTLQNDLALKQTGNSFAFQPSSFNGEKGYTAIATITLNTLNVNAPIVFKLNRRGALCPMQIYIRFASSSETTDPDLASITYEGDNYGALLIKEAVSTWKLYVDNTSGWSNPCLQEWFTTANQMSRISVTFPSEQVDDIPTGLLGYYRAVPAKMQSILDFIYPVGSIYISYSHNSPETLFGGTWVRIENRFLWACDADGGIGTVGGEKTHTLTAKEMPTHHHMVGVANTATGSNAASNKIRYNNDNTSYNGTINTTTAGDGEAHNNMPPYIQVSIWRRTA